MYARLSSWQEGNEIYGYAYPGGTNVAPWSHSNRVPSWDPENDNQFYVVANSENDQTKAETIKKYWGGLIHYLGFSNNNNTTSGVNINSNITLGSIQTSSMGLLDKNKKN